MRAISLRRNQLIRLPQARVTIPNLHQLVPHERRAALVAAQEQPDIMQPLFDQAELHRVRCHIGIG